MRTVKRLTSILLSILLIAGIFKVIPAAVSANEGGEQNSHNHIVLDTFTEAVIPEGESCATFYFQPEEDGTYYFFSDSSVDTYGSIYDNDDENAEATAENDDDGYSNNFKVSAYLSKDTEYILKARFCSEGSGSFYVKISKDGDNLHDYKVTDSKEANCTDQGYTVYTCEHCSYTYQEDTDALGHDIQNGSCSRCDFTCKTIKLDEVTTADSNGNYDYSYFPPEEDGTYYFYSDAKNSDTL